MTRKKRQNYLSPMTRKKRQGGRQDSARCYLVQDGKRKEILLGVWGSPEAKAMYDKLVAEFYFPEAFDNSTPSLNDISLAFLFDRFLTELENRPDSASYRGCISQRQADSRFLGWTHARINDEPLCA